MKVKVKESNHVQVGEKLYKPGDVFEASESVFEELKDCLEQCDSENKEVVKEGKK